MPFNDYRIVGKSFDAVRLLRTGEAVDTSNFRNVRGLEEGRYLRKPETEEDYQLINKAMEQGKQAAIAEQNVQIVDTETILQQIGQAATGTDAEITSVKRGRPPKNGGEN